MHHHWWVPTWLDYSMVRYPYQGSFFFLRIRYVRRLTFSSHGITPMSRLASYCCRMWVQDTNVHSAEKIFRIYLSINKVSLIGSNASSTTTSKSTWVHRSLIRRYIMITSSNVTGCWFALFISKKNYRLMRRIHVRFRDSFSVLGPAPASRRHLTGVTAWGIAQIIE